MTVIDSSVLVSLNSLIKDESFSSTGSESNISNYRPKSIEDLIAEIVAPILESLEELPLTENVSDRKNRTKSIQDYQKKLRKAKTTDHVEKIERAISDKGIIGEDGADAVEYRKKKTEWHRCLDITKRLSKHLGEMIKENPNLGDVFVIKVDKQSSAYPFVLELVNSIKKHIGPA